MNTDPMHDARVALACLDLTSLNDADTEADIAALCQRALGSPARGGHTAAVCVWPRLARFARAQLPAQVAVAAVANFPDGSSDVQRAVRDTGQIVQAGAQEVDVVIPWRDLAAAPALLAAVRRECAGLRLKVILESGELLSGEPGSEVTLALACRMALEAGADFLKTSTGKTPRSATLAAARVLLGAIAADASALARVGFKPSGGIRTVAEAAPYLALTAQVLGAQALTPKRFRIGASSLLNDIESVLAGRAPVAPAPTPASTPDTPTY